MSKRPRLLQDQGRLGSAIEALVRRFSLAERADVSCCGMTVAQAATLQLLEERGPLRLGALGRRLGIRPSTVTRNLQRLEDRGLLERVPDPDDGRALVARLTRRGRQTAAEVGEFEARFAEAVYRALPQQRRDAIVEAIEELLEAVQQATGSCTADTDKIPDTVHQGDPR